MVRRRSAAYALALSLLLGCTQETAPGTRSAPSGAGQIGVELLTALQEPCRRHNIDIVRESGRWYFKTDSVPGGRLGVMEFGEIAGSQSLMQWAAEAERDFDRIATLQGRDWITWEQFTSAECRGRWRG